MEPKGFLKIYFAFYFSPKDADKNDFYQFIKQELVKPRTFTGNNFIKNYRIKVIKNMLMNLDYSIGEIAEILG